MKLNQQDKLDFFSTAATVAVLVFAVYARLLSASFITFDDSVYVVDNPVVNQGLSVEGVLSVLNIKQKSGPYWHPVTSMSHMMDCSLFGLKPALHHMMNLFFHGLNAFILAILLFRLTGERRKSIWVAAIFALHPLNVETVAWISERKNLLATLFFLLGIAAYVFYLRKKVFERYFILLTLFLLGLMSKPIMMTFPFTLFLVHYWPLNGYDLSSKTIKGFFRRNSSRLYPVIVMVVLLVLLFFIVFFLGGNQSNQASMAYRSLGLRLANMLVAYVTYLVNAIIPVNLSVYNPYPETIPVFKTLGSIVVLWIISYAAFTYIRKWPFLFVGWFWYMGNLVTASGLLQQGYFPAHADRFTYLPMIGIYIVVAWGAPLVFKALKWSQGFLTVCAYGVLFVMATLSFKQTIHWQNGISLFSHAVSVHPEDVVSMTNLALALGEDGQLDEAIAVSQKALSLEPNYAEALNNLGTLYAKKGELEKAIPLFDRAIANYPGFELAMSNREEAVKAMDTLRKKETDLRNALEKDPDSIETASSLARVLVLRNKFDEAESLYLKLYAKNPGSGVSISYNLACLHARAGEPDRALTWLETSFSRGFHSWDYLEKDSDFKGLRDTEAYKSLVARYKTKHPSSGE